MAWGLILMWKVEMGMREINFRAWNEVEGFLDTAWSIDFEHRLVCHRAHNQSDLDDCVLMQYTGLKDANGIEIFEGDILGFCDFDSLRTGGNTSDKMHTAVVKFSEGSWVVEEGGYCDYLYQVIANDSELEIIGNIYENKELLEGGEE